MMDIKQLQAKLTSKQRTKTPIVVFIMLLVLTLLSQTYLSTRLGSSGPGGASNALAQGSTDTPTATSTSTSTSTSTATPTATPTLIPVELSFQNGVAPKSTYAGMLDTYISQALPSTTFWQAQELKVNGATAAGNDANYALLKWDISNDIPIGSQIMSASITFNVTQPGLGNIYPIFELLQPWDANHQQTTWTNYDSANPWGAPGASAPGVDRSTNPVQAFAPPAAGTYTLPLGNDLVQSWVDNPAGNHGIIITFGGTPPSALASFDSGDAFTAANRPKLTIKYSWPIGVTPTATFTAIPPPAAPSGLSAVVGSASQINLSWTDNSNTETGFEIERSTDGTNFSLINTVPANTVAFSDTGLSANTIYYYRVRAVNDGGNSVYSNVASASTAATPTPTPTVSGTPPTPTVTGTIVPDMTIVKSVSPSQASVGQLFNFSIKITNNGLAPATSAVLTDTLPSVVTITGASTTKGSYSINTSSNTITFTIGQINPDTSVTVSFLAQVNSTAVSNANYTNSATLTYTAGSTSQSKTSNSVTYRTLGSGSLPGTGLAGIDSDDGMPGIVVAGLGLTILLGLLGAAALVASRLSQVKQSTWGGWLTRTGLILVTAALVFGLVGWGLTLPSRSQNRQLAGDATNTPRIAAQYQEEGPEYPQFLSLTPTPASLPDFPIPNPTVQVGEGEENPDSSPVEHLLIPALGLDTVVKYVPFDGFTWKIAGLKQEIAWLGDTSWPGLGKNTGLAGHVTLNDGSNGPFRYLQDLRAGDVVTLYTQENIYTYKVRESIVVNDDEFSVLKPTDDSQLTLITCTNWDKDLKIYLDRLVVYADLDEVQPIKTTKLGN